MKTVNIINKIRMSKSTVWRSMFSAALTFFGGFLCAWCLCAMAANCINGRTADIMLLAAESLREIKPEKRSILNDRSMKDFIASDPFGTKAQETTSKTQSEPLSLSLEGTLSSHAAYLDGGSGPELVLKGQEFMGFTLVSVGGGDVLVEKDGVTTALYMPLTSAGGKNPPVVTAPRTKKPSVWNREPAKSVTGVEAAGPGVTGALPRELVDKLLMDPYEELAKIRMIPGEGGMKIARIASDSILASVGVIKNDVIKAVNGVTITNLGDATNAINSMMSGTRFDVTVERGGAPVELKYEVR